MCVTDDNGNIKDVSIEPTLSAKQTVETESD